MGKLVVNIKVIASSQFNEDNKNKLLNLLQNYGTIYKIEEVPIGFGVTSFKIMLIADSSLDSDKLEEEFSKIKEAEVKIEDITVMPEL